MRFGICTDSSNAAAARRLGYDYVELAVAEAAAEQPESAFGPVRQRVLDSGLRAEAWNKLLPAALPIVGPAVDQGRVQAYLEVALARAAALGGRLIVWGSPHARHVPDGFPRERAFGQLAEIGHFMGTVAGRHGQLVAIEPLDKATTNTVWTVHDGYDLAQRVAHPHVRTMADIYHMRRNDEPLAAMAAAGSYLAHVHVSDPDRRPPRNPAQFAFYREAFGVLREMGYDGRVSIEARVDDFERDAAEGLRRLREFAIL